MERGLLRLKKHDAAGMSGWDCGSCWRLSRPHPTGRQPAAELKRLCHLETSRLQHPGTKPHLVLRSIFKVCTRCLDVGASVRGLNLDCELV